MSLVVCQGLQSCLEPGLIERRVLRHKLAPPASNSGASTTKMKGSNSGAYIYQNNKITLITVIIILSSLVITAKPLGTALHKGPVSPPPPSACTYVPVPTDADSNVQDGAVSAALHKGPVSPPAPSASTYVPVPADADSNVNNGSVSAALHKRLVSPPALSASTYIPVQADANSNVHNGTVSAALHKGPVSPPAPSASTYVPVPPDPDSNNDTGTGRGCHHG